VTTDYGCVGRAKNARARARGPKIAAGEVFGTDDGGGPKNDITGPGPVLSLNLGGITGPEPVLSFFVGGLRFFGNLGPRVFVRLSLLLPPPLRGPPFSHRAPPPLSSCPPRSPRPPRHVACRPAVPASASRHVLPLVPHSTRPAPLVRCIVYM